MKKKTSEKISIFWKLIISYIVFSFFAVLIVIAVGITTLVFQVYIPQNFEFPGIASGKNGEILYPGAEGVKTLGGWIEELDEDYRVCRIYGEKKTDTMQYTPELLLEWTDLKAGNEQYYLYWQRKKGGIYLIFYPVNAYTISYNFDIDSMFVFSPNIGKRMGLLLVVLLSADIFFVSLYISRKIHKPLRNLISGMKRVEQGEEKVALSMQTEKEFVEIQEAFNRMTKELYAQKTENEKMSQSRSRMLLELSHDIKTPVATIKSYAFALQEGMVPEAEKEKYYRTIALKADRVDQMAADLFTMLKMESADYVLELKKTDIAELTRRVCAEFYEEVTEAGFTFLIEIPERPVYVNGDEALLSRVISNLLTNAKKYNRTGNIIQICLEEQEGAVHLWVKDDGEPISEELRNRMFTAFVRGESTRSTKGGTGLGLAIAKAVMEKHGGNLIYCGEQGNKFEIHIAKVQPL